MQVLGDSCRHTDLLGVAGVAVGRNYDGSGGSVLRNFGDHEIVRADYHRPFHFTETDSGTPQFVRPQAGTEDAHLASRQSGSWRNRLNARLAIHVLLSKETIGQGHQMLSTQEPLPKKTKMQ